MTRELVDAGVGAIIGSSLTAPALAALPIVNEAKKVYIGSSPTGMVLTHDQFTRYFFRFSHSAFMGYSAEAMLMAQKAPNAKKWVAVASDATFGHDIWDAFSYGLKRYYRERAGVAVELRDPLWVRSGTTDFRQQVSQLMASDVEGVLVALVGAEAVTFYTQQAQFGLAEKVKVFADIGTADLIGRALKQHTPNNIWSINGWYYGAHKDNPLSQALYNAYVAKTGDTAPPASLCNGHGCLTVLAAAIRQAQSTDGDKLIPILEGGPFETAEGPVRFRPEDHQWLGSIDFIRLAGDAADPKGWSVPEFASVKAAEVVEPAAPGKPFEIAKLPS
jgi:branched-chain amino acid transport system substrate-binding protein